MDLYGDHHSDQDPERRKPGRTSKDFLKVSRLKPRNRSLLERLECRVLRRLAPGASGLRSAAGRAAVRVVFPVRRSGPPGPRDVRRSRLPSAERPRASPIDTHTARRDAGSWSCDHGPEAERGTPPGGPARGGQEAASRIAVRRPGSRMSIPYLSVGRFQSRYTRCAPRVTAQRSVRSHHSHFLQDLQEHAALTVTHKTLSDNP